MPKIKIEIQDEVTREFDSSEKAVEYLNFMGLRQSDQELRLTVLRGEWVYDKGFLAFGVHKDSGEIRPGAISSYIRHSYYFAPTPELAEELSQVIQGKWQYKKGDRVWSTHRKNPGYVFVENGQMVDHDSRPENLESFASFPSEPQRATFIASIEKAKGETANKFLGFITITGVDLENRKAINVYEDKNGFLTSMPFSQNLI